MYLSPPVRRMRDDPFEEETAVLVVELGDAERSDIDAKLDDVNGTFEGELQLGSVLVSVPEPNVAAFCETGGLERVETAGTLGLALGDGER